MSNLLGVAEKRSKFRPVCIPGTQDGRILLIRAIIEGINYALLEGLEKIEKCTGQKVKSILVFRLSDPEETDVMMKMYGVGSSGFGRLLSTMGYKPMESASSSALPTANADLPGSSNAMSTEYAENTARCTPPDMLQKHGKREGSEILIFVKISRITDS